MVETSLAELQQTTRQVIRELAQRSSADGMKYYYHLAESLLNPAYLHQAREAGKKVVGTFCTLVPDELILAAGAVPVRLCSGFGATITRTEGVCPASLCPLVKSSFGLWLSTPPIASQCDVVAVPTTCDGKKKLSELLSRRLPVWLVQLPSSKESTEARGAWLRQIALLKQHLEHLTGRRVSRKALRTAITVCNKKRASLRKLYELRKEARICGRDALLVAHTSFYDDPVQWTRHTDALSSQIAQSGQLARAAADSPRLLLTGSPVVMPTWKLPMLVE
ncbi:MAG: 2-hydroxyacyl-CoA dehydratase [Armatimonadota bacterium]|nr:MAG: 2-hydroxyacyl-CoA dehydratase [Armatimonadota bacterium]